MKDTEHTKAALDARKKRHKKLSGGYIAEAVLGANDGIITTFAVVTSVVGASLSPGVVVIMGIANLIADGISMGSGSYLGVKSRKQYEKRERRVENEDVERFPKEAADDVRRAYAEKGFEGEVLESIVKTVTEDKELWVKEKMLSELGIAEEEDDSAWKNGLVTFVAFMVAGLPPLLPYIFKFENPFSWTIGFVAATLFVVGGLRSYVTGGSWVSNGLQMLLVGGLAGGFAYGVGLVLESIVGVAL